MSDDSTTPEALKKFQEQLQADINLDKKKKQVQEKRLLVDDYKLTNELNRINKAEQDVTKVSKVNVDTPSDQNIVDLQTRTRYFLEGAKHGMVFLNESFKNVVPAYSGNMVLIGSRTGGGKSSATANLMFSTMQQINPLTKERRKTLVISCEETPSSVYTRLTCLYKAWNFNEQQDFTEEQKEELVNFIPKWAKNGGVTVIGEDGTGITSTIEGIKAIFKNLMDNNIHYDMVIIDYIQKINTSRINPQMKSHEVMRETVNYLDTVKNIYPAVITIFSQLSAQNEDGTKSFEERLRGCHDILTPCTVGIELIPDPKTLTSAFVIHKNRYNGVTTGRQITNVFDKGHYLPISKEDLKKRKEMSEYGSSTLGQVEKQENKKGEENET